MKIGINLTGPSYYSRANVFRNQVHLGTEFSPGNWIITDGGDNSNSGLNLITWKGVGSVFAKSGWNGQISNISYQCAVGYINAGERVWVATIGDVRDLKIELCNSGYFNPKYIKHLKPFNTLRFMDWQQTNTSTIINWTDTKGLDDKQWKVGDNRGIAPEYCLMMAREVNANLWLNIPHLASEDYIINLANLIKRYITDTQLVCYVEYGNEIAWNIAGAFVGGRWLKDQATLLKVRAVDLAGQKTAWVYDIMKPILGDQVKIVLCGQQANVWILAQMAIAANNKFDALSCSWYFGQKNLATLPLVTEDIIFAELDNTLNTTFTQQIIQHKELATKYQVPLVTYEGGQHLTAGGQTVSYQQVLYNVQRDERMYTAYTKALGICRDIGVDLMCHFSDVGGDTKFGSWGAKYDIDDNNAPKWRALMHATAL